MWFHIEVKSEVLLYKLFVNWAIWFNFYFKFVEDFFWSIYHSSLQRMQFLLFPLKMSKPGSLTEQSQAGQEANEGSVFLFLHGSKRTCSERLLLTDLSDHETKQKGAWRLHANIGKWEKV